MASAAGTALPSVGDRSPNGDWTVVAPRRRRGRRRRNIGRDGNSLVPTFLTRPTLTLTPTPWSPAGSAVADSVHVADILRRVRRVVSDLSNSGFVRRVVLSLPARLRRRLSAVESLVVYGTGSFDNSYCSRLQLAFAVLLLPCLDLSASAAPVLFDPVFSSAEVAAATTLGFFVPTSNDHGRRKITSPTLLFMPHCEAELYSSLLDANRGDAEAMNRMVILGNSFWKYRNAAGKVKEAARLVLEAGKCAEEVPVEVEEGEEAAQAGISHAFSDTSWHFFHFPERDAQVPPTT